MNKVLFVSSSFNQFSFSKSIVSKFVEVNDGVKIEKKIGMHEENLRVGCCTFQAKKDFLYTKIQ